MKYGAFLNALKKPPLKKVYLLAGVESFFIEKSKEKILAAIGGDVSPTFFENTSNLENIAAALNTSPLFSDKTVVLIKDSVIFKESKIDSKAKDAELDKFIKIISKLNDETYVIFILNDKPDKRRKIYKTVQQIGAVLEADPIRPKEIDEWLTDKLMSINKTLDKDAYLFFINMISMTKEVNLAWLDKEFDKLAVYTKEKYIAKNMMEEVFSSLPEVSIFSILDAINDKDITKALLLLKREVESGAFVPLILAVIAKHIRQLLQAKTLMREGLRGKNLAAPLGLNPMIAEKVGNVSSLFEENVLVDALILLSDADYLIKTGQGGIELFEEILILLCSDKKRS